MAGIPAQLSHRRSRGQGRSALAEPCARRRSAACRPSLQACCWLAHSKPFVQCKNAVNCERSVQVAALSAAAATCCPPLPLRGSPPHRRCKPPCYRRALAGSIRTQISLHSKRQQLRQAHKLAPSSSPPFCESSPPPACAPSTEQVRVRAFEDYSPRGLGRPRALAPRCFPPPPPSRSSCVPTAACPPPPTPLQVMPQPDQARIAALAQRLKGGSAAEQRQAAAALLDMHSTACRRSDHEADAVAAAIAAEISIPTLVQLVGSRGEHPCAAGAARLLCRLTGDSPARCRAVIGADCIALLVGCLDTSAATPRCRLRPQRRSATWPPCRRTWAGIARARWRRWRSPRRSSA